MHAILAALSAYQRQTSRSRARSLSGTLWDSRSQVASVRTNVKGKGKARADTLSDFDEDEDERLGDAAMRSFYANAHPTEDVSEDAELNEIAQRLEPLQHVEAILKARLVPPSEDEPADLGNGAVGFSTAFGLAKEIFVRPGRWRAGGAGARPATAVASEAADEAHRVLFECRLDLMRLWSSMRMREILALRRVRPEEESGLCVFSSYFIFFDPSLSVGHLEDNKPLRLTCFSVSFQLSERPGSGHRLQLRPFRRCAPPHSILANISIDGLGQMTY